MPIEKVGKNMSNPFFRKKLNVIALLGLTSMIAGASLAFAKEVNLGGKDGWPSFQKENNITTRKGRFGYDCIQIASNSFDADEYTDILIDFEDEQMPISAGDYDLIQNNLKFSNQTINEDAAGLSRNLGGLNVLGQTGSFFGSEGLMGSFTIEFWLCPSIAENGETIVNWESSKVEDDQLIYQLLNASFDKGRLVWTFSNFFNYYISPNGSTDVILKGTSKIIPDQWSYHALSYDAETGLLEYLVNGVTEDLTYITSSGNEAGEVCLVVLGTKSELEICSEYTGKIDDFRIMRRPFQTPDFQSADNAGGLEHFQYLPQGGSFISKPIMVSTGSVLNVLKAEESVPVQTEVLYYVRSGENFYGWTDSYPEWKPVQNGEKITGVTGLYFQVMAELLPDGSGSKSPTITQISLDFSELPEPLPPFVVKAVAGNACVKLSWNYSVDDTAGGYYLYYGTRPGEYLGRIALEGESPINVGNTTSFTVSGLENGKIYYFAIAAWSALDMRVVGELSKEVFARPLARLK